MAKKGGLTKEDLDGLKSLYEILDNFHHDIKEKAAAANDKKGLQARRYLEKFLRKTSADLAALDARIRRGDLALFSKETKAIADTGDVADEKEEEAAS